MCLTVFVYVCVCVCVIALRWQAQVALFREHGLHCHAFGPPCTLGASAAAASAAYITSVVVGDDAVCRWSLGSTKDVLQSAAILVLERGATQRLLRCLCFARDRQGGRAGGRGWERGRENVCKQQAQDSLLTPYVFGACAGWH